MSARDDARVTAVLGPTNTGKTHLAIERMCAHSSGCIGFPLRLLAREVYDRVVALKGRERVALVTGEERIVPKDARWFLCTVESMPMQRDFAFVGIDEAQLGADQERGHVFTDRLLRARGREETMILGSEALRPVLRNLIPGIEIVERPRFSTLSYGAAKKLSRLPRRSAVVAFSAEEVYATAEMLRRLRGGAAVVMGALSPRTRNAQVQMFQAGEVDYLVATDAIGMGLNLDVGHVAFAGLHKFDGRRRRRLTVAEMAQIAGRAGRHQRDGTFGALTEEGDEAFLPEEIQAIEGHRFPKLDWLYWREGEPDLSSIDALIASLSRKPEMPGGTVTMLRPAPEALDLKVLKRLADEPQVRDAVRAGGRGNVARLWAACGIPDFAKLGLDPHARFVGRVFAYLAQGFIPHQWFADEVARLDRTDGDVETIAGRIASIRSWTYIAQRPDWLAEPETWAARALEVEERLSDALHASLTQRFVDKRTTALMRKIGAGAGELPVEIGAEGEVTIDAHAIGRLDGFRFTVAPEARAADKRLLLATAEKRLGTERRRRAEAVIAADDEAFALAEDGGIVAHGSELARLARGSSLARPAVVLDPALACLDPQLRERVATRVRDWVTASIAKRLPALAKLAEATRAAEAGPALRSIAGALETGAGIAARAPLTASLDALDGGARHWLRRAGVTIGALDLFDPRLLKPGARAWRQALIAAMHGAAPPVPPAGATVLPRATPGAMVGMGYRPLGAQAVRIDLVERIARAAHEARAASKEGARAPFAADPALATSIGLEPETLARLMAELGFRAADRRGGETADGSNRYVWRGRPRPKAPPAAAAARPGNAFAALGDLMRAH
ncbi:ATP-dependent RNA helicase SUPV3L1/SUV3 [Sphingomonas palmae]|uniref:ATP-dependent RNA helicase SUPV3L1/SUV3 n=1 Tax=Sphingomonas palmae TaxID=1855283 RepID=A0A1H7SDG3_9SPHN|nr:helicase-related protein [Sphingomonas palmae]SEL70246.1 ATP-dependent RNA helicase SUPV3L1/SUV3 [Sphingomonas palmae]